MQANITHTKRDFGTLSRRKRSPPDIPLNDIPQYNSYLFSSSTIVDARGFTMSRSYLDRASEYPLLEILVQLKRPTGHGHTFVIEERQ